MPARGKGSYYQGSKWCWPPTRWAILWRDRCKKTNKLRCLWCNTKATVDEVYAGKLRLCLDHLDPVYDGGTNHPTNLVSACLSCNSSRGKESFEDTCVRAKFNPLAFKRVAKLRDAPLDRARGRALHLAAPKRPWRKPTKLGHHDQLAPVPESSDANEEFPKVDWDKLFTR